MTIDPIRIYGDEPAARAECDPDDHEFSDLCGPCGVEAIDFFNR